MNPYTRDYLTLDVPVPPPGPDEGPVCFTFDAKWVPYVVSVVKSLTMDGVYASDQDRAKGEASLLLASFMEQFACSTKPDLAGSEIDDCMGCCIRMRDGVLQVLQCGEWVAVDGWDSAAIGSAINSPKKGDIVPPPGGCQTYIGKVNAASAWALPATVNTGDVITVTNALGSWWTPLDLGIQRCPDGLIYFAGGCVDGTGHTESGDPLNTAPHDCLIAYDGTHYYDCSAAADGGPATFTIGSGVVNGHLVMMMNTPDTIGFGEVAFDIEICNHVSEDWSHVIDLTVTNLGFTDDGWIACASGDEGHWAFGSGLLKDNCLNGITHYETISLEMVFSSVMHIDTVLWTYDKTIDPANAGTDVHDVITWRDSGSTQHTSTDLTPGNVTGATIGDTTPRDAKAIGIRIGAGSLDVPASPTGAARVYQLKVTGHGTDPFASFL